MVFWPQAQERIPAAEVVAAGQDSCEKTHKHSQTPAAVAVVVVVVVGGGWRHHSRRRFMLL